MTSCPRLARATRSVLACAGVATGASCDVPSSLSATSSEPTLYGVVASRSSLPRLSVEVKYAPCEVDWSSRDKASQCAGGGAPAPVSLARLQLRLSTLAGAADTRAEALHGLALIDLIAQPSNVGRLDSALARLEESLQLGASPGRVLSDMAAAHLLRYEAGGDPMHLFRAIEAADAALQQDAGAPAAFNLAVALQRAHLGGEALAAWRKYGSVEHDSQWASEAAKHAAGVRRGRRRVPRAGWSRDSLAAFARSRPQEARVTGFDHWLGEWGEATSAADHALAKTFLRAATEFGKGLKARSGDNSLMDAVTAIQSADSNGRNRLAHAHALYRRAQMNTARLRHSAALALFDSIALVDPPEPLRGWTAAGRAIALVYVGDSATTNRELRDLATHVDADRYPALAGRVHWARGTVALRGGSYEAAMSSYARARRLFVRLGEIENAAAMDYLTGEALLNLGNRTAGFRAIGHALSALASVGPSVWLHNALIVTSRFLEGEGLPRAARRLSNEDVRVATRLGDALGLSAPPSAYLAEAILARARLTARFEPTALPGQLARAESLLATTPAEFARPWIVAQAQYIRASVEVDRNPRAAVAILDSAIISFAGKAERSSRNGARHVSALVLRARGRAALGQAARAEADLDAAMSLIDSVRAEMSREGNREALVDATRQVVDRLIMARFAVGDTVGALRVSDCGRVAIDHGRCRTVDPRQARGTMIVLRLVDSALFTWVMSSGRVTLTASPVDTSELFRRVTHTRVLMERGTSEHELRPGLARLYSEVIGPVRQQLRDDHITIIADGALAGVPFAALLDSSGYLVQEYSIRLETSVRDALRAPAVRRPQQPTKVTLVANPDFDASVHPDLARLARVDAEVSDISAVYGAHSRVISGRAAHAAAVIRSIGDAELFHFAGHAIGDEAHPEDSFLLLARDGAGKGGRLTAAMLRELDLSRLRLAVLAACQTLASAGGPEGFRGLSSALRQAGVHGVVGSLWRVEDAATAALMPRFHSRYSTSGDAARSLRDAQRDLIASNDPYLRSPSAWAAFQYHGR